ncbi:MAG TPA: hypothetical protein VKM94_20970 [Blastocatellia bacterium]|nr:hypothetical protein [Blastocatellia bacterium]
MIERRHPAELYAAELERARTQLRALIESTDGSASEICAAAVRVKELELRLAASRLAQAEYYLASLKARVSFLEARTATPGVAARAEEQELSWAREALPSNIAAVASLSEDVTRLKHELKGLTVQAA